MGLMVRRWALLALGRVSPVLGLGLWRGVLGGPAGGVPDELGVPLVGFFVALRRVLGPEFGGARLWSR